MTIEHKKWIIDNYLNDKDYFLQFLQDFGCEDFIIKLQCTSSEEISKDINTGKMIFKDNIHNKYWLSLNNDITSDPIKIYNIYFEKYKLFDKNVLIEFYNNTHGIGINVNKVPDDHYKHIQEILERKKECETRMFYKTKDFYLCLSFIVIVFSVFIMLLSLLFPGYFNPISETSTLSTTFIICLIISCIGIIVLFFFAPHHVDYEYENAKKYYRIKKYHDLAIKNDKNKIIQYEKYTFYPSFLKSFGTPDKNFQYEYEPREPLHVEMWHYYYMIPIFPK